MDAVSPHTILYRTAKILQEIEYEDDHRQKIEKAKNLHPHRLAGKPQIAGDDYGVRAADHVFGRWRSLVSRKVGAAIVSSRLGVAPDRKPQQQCKQQGEDGDSGEAKLVHVCGTP
jgi:hypothetical protein